MPTSFDPSTATLAGADAVLAGTLCLMSCFVQHRLPLYAERIASNLHVLALDAALTAEMRTLCERLAMRWNRVRTDALHEVMRTGTPSDARSLH